MDATPVQGDVVVRGTVRDVWHHKPISGAVVYAVSGTTAQAAVTNAKGNFYFLALLPGNYQFSARAPGYGSECLNWGRQDDAHLAAGYEYDTVVWLANACH